MDQNQQGAVRRSRARQFARWGIWSAYPARTRPGRSSWVPFALAMLLAVLLWWGVTASGGIDALYLPSPLDVLDRMVRQVKLGHAWQYLRPTLTAAVLGAGIAALVGVPLGVMIAHSRLLAAIAEPVVAISQTIPLVAIAPLLVLWIGYGTLPIAILCAIIAFFPMVTTTVVGFRSLDMRLVDNALLDGANVWQRLTQVEFPIAAPAVLAGVRGGVVLAMTGAVVGELVMGGSGIGTLLTLYREAADTAGVFAVVAWTSGAALLLYGLVLLVERAAVARIQGENL